MLKRYWYWWVIGVLLFIIVAGNSNPDIVPVANDFAETIPIDNQFENSQSEVLATLQEAEVVQLSEVANELDSTGTELSKETPAAMPDRSLVLYQVLRVIDGDTIEVMFEGEKKTVRYIGIDTPETVHPSKPVECMGKEASVYNKSLVEGKRVQLEIDISNTDKYGRLLRYVYMDGVMVNELLVKEGYANVLTYPPDVKYDKHFLALEREARVGKKGLWSEVCADDVSATSPAPIAVVHSSPSDISCTIKGNISASGEKIFHVPGCQSYEKTVITEEAGERWFCSEQEALQSGWRKALNCE